MGILYPISRHVNHLLTIYHKSNVMTPRTARALRFATQFAKWKRDTAAAYENPGDK